MIFLSYANRETVLRAHRHEWMSTREVAEGKMDQELKLTARGHAIYELMADLGLSLDAACAHVDQELATLHRRVAEIVSQSKLEDLSKAMQAALGSVSPSVQDAYLEESAFESVGALCFGSASSSAALH